MFIVGRFLREKTLFLGELGAFEDNSKNSFCKQFKIIKSRMQVPSRGLTRMQLLPDLDDEAIVAPEVLVDEGGEEVGRVERRRVLVDVQLEQALVVVVRRAVGEVLLVADDVAPLLGEEAGPVAPVLEDHPVSREDPSKNDLLIVKQCDQI